MERPKDPLETRVPGPKDMTREDKAGGGVQLTGSARGVGLDHDLS